MVMISLRPYGRGGSGDRSNISRRLSAHSFSIVKAISGYRTDSANVRVDIGNLLAPDMNVDTSDNEALRIRK